MEKSNPSPEKSNSFERKDDEINSIVVVADTCDDDSVISSQQTNETDDKNNANKSESESEPEKQMEREMSEKRDDEIIEINEQQQQQEPTAETETNPLHVSKEIDRFLTNLSNKKKNDDSDDVDVNVDATNEIPDFVEKFTSLVDAKIAMYESGDGTAKWRQVAEEDTSFLEDVDRLWKLSTSLSGLKTDPNYASSLNRIGVVLHKSMSFLEDEFRSILEDSRSFSSSGGNDGGGGGGGGVAESETTGEASNDFHGYSDDVIQDLNKIAKAMISGGYETECCQVYTGARRVTLDESLNKLGFENHSIDDVLKMQWDSLDREITTWINAFKQCATVYFSGEYRLAMSVFSDYPSIGSDQFIDLTRCFLIQLLNFAEAVAMTKRSSDKLFKFLDMYETLRDTVKDMDVVFPDDCASQLKAENSSAKSRIGESAIRIFGELETSIKSDSGKTQVPGGAVHPLTRYTMNYLDYACGYKDTLGQVFKEHHLIERADSTSGSDYQLPSHATPEMARDSPFSVQLMRVMSLLDTNLEGKSKLYKDLSLSYIFLMNNGRYILQKIKGSSEINQLMGDTWCRKRSSDLRQYHKNYQRETWHKVLSALSHEGVNVNGKVVKPALKERFKSFNMLFDEVHRTQSTWVVSDEQLQSELRVSISALVIPAYRAFFGRFSQYLTAGRQTEKYIKFQPEDIENYIDDLFDGNPALTGKKKP